MTGTPADWEQILAGVTGTFMNGEERISTHDLLTQHLGVAITDRATRRLRRHPTIHLVIAIELRE